MQNRSEVKKYHKLHFWQQLFLKTISSHDVGDIFPHRGDSPDHDTDFLKLDATMCQLLSHVVSNAHCIITQSFAPPF